MFSSWVAPSCLMLPPRKGCSWLRGPWVSLKPKQRVLWLSKHRKEIVSKMERHEVSHGEVLGDTSQVP